jgi:hypothetical protein
MERKSKVTESMQASRSVGTNSRLHDMTLTRRGRALLLGIVIVLILASAAGSFVYGRKLTYADVTTAAQLNQQVTSENQTLNRQVIDQSSKLTAMQADLTNAKALLNEIMPTENTFNINPNQSMIVADGHLTVGLIGSPTNEGVRMNVNGKQQMVAAGDIIRVALDPSTNCQVAIQSFDFFRAVFTASCAAAKPQ